MMTPIKTGRETAEEKFAAAQKKTKKAIDDKEQAQIVRADHTAGLRARRLAKQAVEKKAADEAAADKAAAKKPAKKKKVPASA